MKKKMLIIGFVWPEPTATAAGSRMLQLIDAFQKSDFQITFVSTATKSDLTFDLKNLGIKTHSITLNHASFDTFLQQINPDIVLFDRFLTEEQFGWKIAQNCPNAFRILDTEDLHFLRKARESAFKNEENVSLKHLTNTDSKREIASIYRCDVSLIISKYEYQLLTDTFKIDASILLYLPFLVSTLDANALTRFPSFEKRSDFMSIGNFLHAPNLQAVLYLKNTIWPFIREQLPKASLYIYGAYIPERIKQLNNIKEGFIIKGWAKSSAEVFKKAKICLAPLQFGAGLKGKLLDSMQYGTPNITTKIGAEAMHDNLDWNGFITDNPEEFAKEAIQLYQNKNIWKTAQKNGIAIVNQCFDEEKYKQKLIETVQYLINNLEKHRLNNFIGSMLQHHTLQSTKYLSKWIEEKNKT